jgi:HlyD family secretion protein
VLYDGDQALLQVVENGRIATTEVTLGARANGFVEVVSGIGEGTDVVARAGTFVADGDMVTPVRGEQTGSIKP